MADPMLALIGAITVSILAAGAFFALVIYTAIGFYRVIDFICRTAPKD